MKQVVSKKDLAVALSRLKGFVSAKVRVEQYMTDSEIAADVVWNMGLLGDIGKVSVDLGAGTGILGIGMALMGSEKVYLVEQDRQALQIAKENALSLESEDKIKVVHDSIANFNEKVDCVLMNPPFGTKSEGADKRFLEKAFGLADVVWSFHKTSTKDFIKSYCEGQGFRIDREYEYKFPIKKTMEHHKKARELIDVSVFRIVRE